MRADNFSPPERKELALKIKEELEKEGFNTIWSDETTVQVEDLPIPKIVPFDTAKLTISIEENYIYFAIVIKFIKVLEDCIEPEEIEKVCELHNDWSAELSSYLSSIDTSAKFKWDVEYDVDIEDTMCGFLDTVEEVIPFIHNLRKLIDYKTKEV